MRLCTLTTCLISWRNILRIVGLFRRRSTNEQTPEIYLLVRLNHHRCLIICYSSKLFVEAAHKIGQEIIIGVLFYVHNEKRKGLNLENNR